MSHRFTMVSLVSLVGLSFGNAGCELIDTFEGWTPHEGGMAGNAGSGGNAASQNKGGSTSIVISSRSGGSSNIGGGGASNGNATRGGMLANNSGGAIVTTESPSLGGESPGGSAAASGASSPIGTTGSSSIGLGGAVTSGQGGSGVAGSGASAPAGGTGTVATLVGVGGAAGGNSTIGGKGATELGGATASGGAAVGGTAGKGGANASGATSTGNASSCVIESVTYASGTKKSGNACLICAPTISTNSWSPSPDGTKCDDGQVCSSGVCQAGCWIGGSIKAPDTPNPAKGCETCQPASSLTSWSTITEGVGTGCASGQVCHSGGCTAGCWIGSAYYAANKPNAANGCQSCQPGTSTSAWTTLAEGISTGCPSGQVCHGGACTSGCWIGSTYYSANAANPNGLCKACQPGTKTNEWSSDAAACVCSGTLQTVHDSSGLCVAKLVPIPGPTTATNYSIDATEVTRKQYAMWLTTAPSVASQDSATCGWNTTFGANSSCMSGSFVCKGSCDNHPQACVNWCDAYAYCKGVGKHLCGKIGGGPNLYNDYANQSLSAWYRACSSGGALQFPYANDYVTLTCNDIEYWSNPSSRTTVAVGFLTSCQAASPYSGVYDLSGNVAEWEDSCDITTGAGAAALCHQRGGGITDGNAGMSTWCGNQTPADRNNETYDIGFRCCSP